MMNQHHAAPVLQVITSAPDTSTFLPLKDYQSSTPESFFSGPQVLYYHNKDCRLLISAATLSSTNIFSNFSSAATASVQTTSATPSTSVSGADESIQDFDDQTSLPISIYVTPQYLTLWCEDTKKGINIPYKHISWHAQQGKGLFMQLELNDPGQIQDDGEDADNTVEIVIVPSTQEHAQNGEMQEHGTDDKAQGQVQNGVNGKKEQSEIEKLFAAVTSCAELNPDSDSEDEDGGQGGRSRAAGLMSMMQLALGGGNYTGGGEAGSGGGLDLSSLPDLGGGGWITVDNVDECVDEEGHVRFPGSEEEAHNLGPGAGHRRDRNETVAEDKDIDGGSNEANDAKWQRTE